MTATRSNHPCDGLSSRVAARIMAADLADLGRLSVTRLAEEFDTTPFQLWRSFRTDRGLPLGRFLLHVKLLRCALLLHSNPGFKIRDLSKMAGFSPKIRRF